MKNRNPQTSKKHMKTPRWFSPNRFLSILRIASGGALLFAAMALPAAALADTSRVYYVALGDSLATGAQPAPSGEPNHLRAANGTNRGYVDDLYAAERAEVPNLQLRNFGCGSESTQTMINGGASFDVVCGYGRTSQLDQAVAFLEAHQGQIAFITIDIGANDAVLCVFQRDQACLNSALASMRSNLAIILSRLREAAGPDVPIIGMNYYDPLLAFWFSDPTAAQVTEQMVVQVNDVLGLVYGAAGDPVADVETAFSTTDFTLQPDGVPLNVERICEWTWMCSIGNIHANDDGYGVIARAFEQVLP
jgi:lysophospholipase L1-like esterase